MAQEEDPGGLLLGDPGSPRDLRTFFCFLGKGKELPGSLGTHRRPMELLGPLHHPGSLGEDSGGPWGTQEDPGEARRPLAGLRTTLGDPGEARRIREDPVRQRRTQADYEDPGTQKDLGGLRSAGGPMRSQEDSGGLIRTLRGVPFKASTRALEPSHQ